jgi:hypothetical protein
MHRPQLTTDFEVTTASQGPYAFACTFYGIKPTSIVPTTCNSNVPFISAFESLICVSTSFAQSLLAKPGKISPLREVYTQSLLLVDRLVGRLGSSVVVSWDPSKWLSFVLQILDHEVGVRGSN